MSNDDLACMASPFADGAVVGIGSLPHNDPAKAAAFAIGEFEIATIPTLPNRSSAEGMIAQALAGVAGLSVDERGTVAVDSTGFTGEVPRKIDIAGDAYMGLDAFLELAGDVHLDGSPVKWQCVGPITLGVALCRAGLDRATAFDLALAAVRTQLSELSKVVAAAMPSSQQMVFLDEPSFIDLMSPDFPIPPDEAIDRLSSAMAALPVSTTSGIHVCGSCDVATLLAAGAGVVSVPVTSQLIEWAGYLTQYLGDGGIIAWGVLPTDGPIPMTSDRSWRALSDVWCGMVERGCDPVLLRRGSMITPHCGLAQHSVGVARRIARLTADVGHRVKDQSTATRFALGA